MKGCNVINDYILFRKQYVHDKLYDDYLMTMMLNVLRVVTKNDT